MSTIDRATILRGPALVTYGGQTFWSKGNVTVTPKNRRFGIPTAHFGEVDERYSSRSFEVTFEPSGAWTAGALAVLLPYGSTAIGTGIYGSSDSPLVVWSRDNKKLTIHNARVTKQPPVRLSVAKTTLGSITFTGLVKNSTAASGAAAYYTLETASYPGDSGFAVSDIKTLAYASAWGTSPWDAFLTQDGWEIATDITLQPDTVDGIGDVDMILTGMSVTAKCIPVGPAQSDILAKIAPAVGLGTSVAAAAAALNISATGVYARVYNAAIVESGFDYANDRKRIAATTWKATRTVTGGTADPLFYVGTAAPA